LTYRPGRSASRPAPKAPRTAAQLAADGDGPDAAEEAEEAEAQVDGIEPEVTETAVAGTEAPTEPEPEAFAPEPDDYSVFAPQPDDEPAANGHADQPEPTDDGDRHDDHDSLERYDNSLHQS